MEKLKSGEKHKRSIAKAASWRIFATMDTMLLSWLFTGEIGAALKIGLSEVFTKIGLFYLHERIWETFRFGRVYSEADELVREKHYRSIIKGISWRFFGTMDTMLLALFWTGDYRKAFYIGSAELITKVGLFWLHERIWWKINWGRKPAHTPGTTPLATELQTDPAVIEP